MRRLQQNAHQKEMGGLRREMEGRLVIDSVVGCFVLKGDRQEHCFIDFIYGRCTQIEEVLTMPNDPLVWCIRKIRTISKIPLPGAAIEPFEGRLADGWLLYELPKRGTCGR